MPFCHLAREIKGLQQAAYEQVSGENESALHRRGKLESESESVWSNTNNTHSEEQRALEENGKFPQPQQGNENNRCFSKMGCRIHMAHVSSWSVTGPKEEMDSGQIQQV